jgi:DNA-binding SARP family transcriptional activator/tetratricopeptide (TPR) repeat protein
MSGAGAGAADGSVDGGRLRLQILGPVRVWRGDVELDTGPRQQSRLLAILLARAGRPVGARQLIEMIWGQSAPPSALNTLHKYVGALRHLLEPDLPPRRTGHYLQRRGEGYLCTAGPDTLDLVAFRTLLSQARVALAHQRYRPALDTYVEALGLWRGSAGTGADDGPAAPVFTPVTAEFLDAAVAAAALAGTLGRPNLVLPALRLGSTIDPLHEPVQASLISALGAAGQQAEALSVYRTLRARLAEELGVDPSPMLVAAHARVLGQAEPPLAGRRPVRRPAAPPAPSVGLVGRAHELVLLSAAVESAAAGTAAVVVVEGEPGIGKTRLLEEIGVRAGQREALVVWGRCAEGDGAPTMWPWVQVIRAIVRELRPALRAERLTGELHHLDEPGESALVSPVLPDSGAKFRLFEQVVSLVGEVADGRPVVLLIDDLQWADPVSVQMFGHLGARLPGRTAVFGALRDRAPAPGPDLVQMLAGVSRLPRSLRVRLDPLAPDEVAELVERENGGALGGAVARQIYLRTAGNPFFVRELSRFLADGAGGAGDAASRPNVPSTVMDVVRQRISGLDEEARHLLQVAAVIGSDVDLDVLASAIGVDEQSCLDRLEPLEGLGLIAPPIDPRQVRFAHDIVRESVVQSTPRRSLASMHLHVADALERAKAADEIAVERFAHHLWAAGPLAEPARTADALICAGRAAAAKSAFEAADRLLQSAAQLARRAGLAEVELSALAHLTAVVGMRSGYVGSGLDLLRRAEQLARGLGRQREAADLLFSRWAAHSQGIRLDRAAPLARRLLEQGEASTDPMVRAYGWSAWGIHQWDLGNIGEAFRYLGRANAVILEDREGTGEAPLRRDLQLLWPVMLALMTALHGDVAAARSLFDTLEVDAEDDPYAITVWAAFSVVTAAVAGDPAWALRAAERGIAVDPEYSFVFLGGYQRLARCWARAISGDDPVGAATEAEAIIGAVLLDPPRSGLATWYGLLAEMLLAAGLPSRAAEALDRADESLETHGQRYPEGLLLYLRAKVQQSQGDPAVDVRATAERARSLSVAREAHLFAQRAETLVAEMTRSG